MGVIHWASFTEGLKLLGLVIAGNMLSALIWEMYPVLHTPTLTWVFVLAGISLLLIVDTEVAPQAQTIHHQKNIYDR